MFEWKCCGSWSFCVNVLVYLLTGSQNALEHIYILIPGGSYTTVKYWLHNNSSTELICPISDDVITFFDNSQMFGRNWRVRFDCKALISCITSMIHISSNTSSTFQNNPQLCPYMWLTVYDWTQNTEYVGYYCGYHA